MIKYYITINDFNICISGENIYEAAYAAHEVYMSKMKEDLHDMADMPFWMKVNQEGFTVPNSKQVLIPYAIIMGEEWDGTGTESFCGEDVTPEMLEELSFLDGQCGYNINSQEDE